MYCLKSKIKKILKQRLGFSFENKIEAMDRLVKMHGEKVAETTLRFST